MSDLKAAQARLNAARARRRRQKAGPPLAQTDADLETLAQAGPHDLGTVAAFIHDAAGEMGVALFRAKREG